jgi:hypothetical protein
VGCISFPPGEDYELAGARFRTFDMTPEPTLPIEVFARIAAEVGAATSRAAVLERHGLREEDWMLEERGYTARVGLAIEKGDLELPRAFEDAMTRARKEHAG